MSTRTLLGTDADAGGDELSVSARTAAEVFATVLTRGPISRRDIARATGLSQSTITKAVKPMLAAGYLIEEREEAHGPGRPANPLRVDAERHLVVGIKVAAHELIGVVTNSQARVLASAHRPLPSRELPEVVAQMVELTSALVATSPEYAERVEGIGIGVGGHVDGRVGTLRYSPILGWSDVPLADVVRDAVGLPAVVENDVNALAVAEHLFGAGRGIANFALVTVGAGVGCGLVVHGELVHGATGMAGELGHVVVDPDGEVCPCGNRGCLETVASDRSILAAIARDGGPFLTSIGEAALLAREGDERARAVFSNAGAALGRGLSLIANLFNPTRIILSGEGVIASDLLLDRLAEALERHTFTNRHGVPELVTRPLSDEAWARGAAATLLRHLISHPVDRAASPGAGRR